MFRFFTIKKWYLWSWIGSLIILSSLWVQVKIDVKINEWFGEFYDMIQKALAEPNAVSIEEYFASLFSFFTLAGMYIFAFFIKMVGAAGFEPATLWSQTRCATRLRYAPIELLIH